MAIQTMGWHTLCAFFCHEQEIKIL